MFHAVGMLVWNEIGHFKFVQGPWAYFLFSSGDYVMVEPIEEGDKVKAEIVHILYKQQIKYIAEQQMWQVIFLT